MDGVKCHHLDQVLFFSRLVRESVSDTVYTPRGFNLDLYSRSTGRSTMALPFVPIFRNSDGNTARPRAILSAHVVDFYVVSTWAPRQKMMWKVTHRSFVSRRDTMRPY